MLFHREKTITDDMKNNLIEEAIQKCRREDGLLDIGKYDEEALREILLNLQKETLLEVMPEETNREYFQDKEGYYIGCCGSEDANGYNECRQDIIKNAEGRLGIIMEKRKSTGSEKIY